MITRYLLGIGMILWCHSKSDHNG